MRNNKIKQYNKMELRIKNYSTNNTELDSLLNSAFTSGYLFAQREYTKWDETDNLKRAKDSDILAEEKKKTPGLSAPIMAGVGGAITGAATGAVAGGILGGIKKKGILNGLKKGSKWGAVIGGTALAAGALKKRNKEKSEVQFYNDRLAYAKRQAERRERRDWKENMTQREGYSY
jgi:hypothetical protein